MKTKLFRLFAALLLILTAQTVSAYDFEAKNSDGVTIYYNITSSTGLTCEVTYKDYVQYKGAINIPSTVSSNGKTYSVTSIGKYAFENGFEVTSVTIPDGITTIGSEAFIDCRGLTSMIFPNSVTKIGNQAFENCQGLKSVTLPNNLTTIEIGSFLSCDALESVTIPSTVTDIKDAAFTECRKLKKVICLGMTPPTIEKDVFSQTPVSGCTLYVPSDSVDTYKQAYVCKDFSKVLQTACDFYSYNKGHILYFNLTSSTDLTCEVTYKEYNLANYYEGEVNIPSSVSFDGKEYRVTGIGNQTFYRCSALTSISIPDGVTSIGDHAFYDCSALTAITIPDNVTTIGRFCFSGCSGLKSIIIPNSVIRIGGRTFEKCGELKEITCLNPTPPTLDKSVFEGVSTSTCVLKVPEGSVDAYKAADQWKEFMNIEGVKISAIDAATTDADSDINAPAYNMQGVKVNSNYKGIVIRNGKKFLKR